MTGLADSFNPNANARVYSMAVQTDGKIVAAGQFTNIGGQPRNYMARLDATTGLADSFDPNGNGPLPEPGVYAVVLQADGKILACGRFGTIGGQPRNNIARARCRHRIGRFVGPKRVRRPSWRLFHGGAGGWEDRRGLGLALPSADRHVTA